MQQGLKMKLETIKTDTVETFVQAGDISISVTQWGNMEGANVMVLGKDFHQRLACAMEWSEIDALIVALAAARA